MCESEMIYKPEARLVEHLLISSKSFGGVHGLAARFTLFNFVRVHFFGKSQICSCYRY